MHDTCMLDTFARARTRPPGQARATIGYLIYKQDNIACARLQGANEDMVSRLVILKV